MVRELRLRGLPASKARVERLMTADIATDALTMAWFRRKSAAGLIHHLDRGSQYAATHFR